MKDAFRRLLMRHSILRRDPETEKPWVLASGAESWVYLDVRRSILLPHGLFACGKVLLQTFLEDEEITVGAIAGPSIGGIPLAASLTLAAYEFDQEEAPPMLMVRPTAKGHGTGNLIEGLDNVGVGTNVLVVEDVVTSGTSTIRTIAALKEAGLNPVLVIAVVDREAGGLGQITETTGVRAIALYTMGTLLEPSLDDHVLFIPAPGEGVPEGIYLMRTEPGKGWQPCSPEQNDYLHSIQNLHIPHTPENTEGLDGAEEMGIFFIEGVLRP